MDCTRLGCNAEYAFDNAASQGHLGCWEEGKQICELEVFLPGRLQPAEKQKEAVEMK